MTILIILFFCHFLADFTPLSTQKMLNAKALGTPLMPIWEHASVHSSLMMIPLYIFTKDIWFTFYLMGFQALTHFMIDVWKGKMNLRFPICRDNTNKAHWILFGFDQFLHAVVIIIMYYLIINQ
ncbi:MAG TPA: DUF3307 domain-containing protein [Burkholderiales bacterium]|mgnify:CR=1 FL=1|nr:DUF3307 domain-containing protein [Burkholderiales bacterium]